MMTPSALVVWTVLSLLCLVARAGDPGNSGWAYATYGADWKGLCATGLSQSPVSLTDATIDAELQSLDFSQWSAPLTYTLTNNGHTIQVDSFGETSYLIDRNTGIKYQLAQFHFHIPSEHAWGGSLVDAELHLVHVRVGGSASKGTDLLVVGIGFVSSEYSEDEFLNTFWTNLTSVMRVNRTLQMSKSLIMRAVLPGTLGYYTYSGSLTTPPCTEGVKWYVMQNTLTLSVLQVDFLRMALNYSVTEVHDFEFDGNRRHIKELNGRVVRQFSPETSAAVSKVAQILAAVTPTPTTPTPAVASSSSSSSSGVATVALIFGIINALFMVAVVYTLRYELSFPYLGRVFPWLVRAEGFKQGHAELGPMSLTASPQNAPSGTTVVVK